MENQPLALQRAGREAKHTLSVTSPAIHGTIAKVQSEYGEGVSPEIWWDRVEGAKVLCVDTRRSGRQEHPALRALGGLQHSG
jgi:hypothetical protein